MNACKQAKLLIPYSNDELSQAETTAIRSHLETCAACRETLSQVRDLGSLAGVYRRPAVSNEVKESYYSALERHFPMERPHVFRLRSGTDGMQVWRTAVVFTAAAAIIVLAVISGRQIGRVNRGRPFVMASKTVVVRNSHPQVEQFLREAEMLLLDLKNASGDGFTQETVHQAQKLIERLPGIHDIAMEESNTSLLSFLVQSELIFYEASNYRDDSSPAVWELIREGAGSVRLWETLGNVRKATGTGFAVVITA